jgi:hypothetical protein
MPKSRRIASGLSLGTHRGLAQYIEDEFDEINRKLGSGRGWQNPKWVEFADRLLTLGIRNARGMPYTPEVAKATFGRVKARILKQRGQGKHATKVTQRPAGPVKPGSLEDKLRARVRR